MLASLSPVYFGYELRCVEFTRVMNIEQAKLAMNGMNEQGRWF